MNNEEVRYGAAGVWVGTRFVASVEAGAPPRHKEMVISAGYDDTVRTLIYSGRPMSVRKTPYVAGWCVTFVAYWAGSIKLMISRNREDNRQQEIRELTSQGKVPHEVELDKHPEKSLEGRMCKLSFFSLRQMRRIYRGYCRVDGESGWCGQRYQTCEGDVSSAFRIS